MLRFVLLVAFSSVCFAGVANYNGATVIAPTVTSEHQNVLRSYGNLQQVSYNSKTIDTPYSSVSKHDVRVSNPGIAISQPVAYHSAPAAYQHAPAAIHAAPAVVAPTVYQAPQYHAHASQYQAPTHYQAPIAAAPTLLGVKYSPSTSVSHMTYSAPVYSYAW
ncbi:hypothetical protein ACKWTF_005728 [Chironomus riparius]